jgi:hypothetical protein
MHSKYNNPNTSGKQQQIVSTAELQRSHYSFGSSNNTWNTTTQSSYGPKFSSGKLHTKNLTATNFVLGDDIMPIKSVSHQTYVPHLNQEFKQANKELSSDLRQHHFKFGNDAPTMTSINHMDYVSRNLNDPNMRAKIDQAAIRKSHFNIGDKTQPSNDHFESTYQKAMNNKGNVETYTVPNSTYKSSVNIKGTNIDKFVTESQAK